MLGEALLEAQFRHAFTFGWVPPGVSLRNFVPAARLFASSLLPVSMTPSVSLFSETIGAVVEKPSSVFSPPRSCCIRGEALAGIGRFTCCVAVPAFAPAGCCSGRG